MRTSLIGIALVLVSSVQTQAATLLHCGKLIDVAALEVLGQRTIVVEGNTIRGVDEGYTPPSSNDQSIDLRSATCLPGLMDSHVHLSEEYSAHSYIEKFQLNGPDYAIKAVVNAEKTLMAGFTQVRELGDRSHGESIALRNAINEGLIVGPRIIAVGKSIATTGGHADSTVGRKRDLMFDVGPEGGVVNSPYEARKAVRQRYKHGADMIKITATGGVLSVAKSGQNPQFMNDELEAIVATASDYGMPVAAHAHGTEGMYRAVAAGVDSIEHGTYMDDRTMKLMKKKGTWYVPTLMAGKWIEAQAEIEGFFPEVVRVKAATIGPLIVQTFARAYQAGVPIAFGTDSGVSAHGDNAQEFNWMVGAGMPVMEAIQSATLNAAKLTRTDDHLGKIAPDYLADIIAVPEDPREDVTTLSRVNFVMKDGKIYKQ